jgi:D-beta-D-heptose 7-phosphate kinase/D-beta-D-heptose 1-phosphate adenosyltransferase
MKSAASKLARIVKAMSGRRIGVVGDLMLDRYVWGTASRLSPEAAVPVVDFVEESAALGGAGNVAANLVALGARVRMFGVVGVDDPAAALLSALRAQGVPPQDVVTDPSRKTTLKTRIIARHQQVVRVDRETRQPIAAALEEKLIRRIISALKRLDALIISDYEKGAVTEALADRVLAACGKLGVPAFVKPKWSRLPTYPGATAIVLNRSEASFLTTRPLDDDASVEEAGQALLAHFASPAVLITRGDRGLSVFEQGAARGFHVAATCHDVRYVAGASRRATGREVFDVTGAGDTVLATLALAHAAGANFREGALLGNAAAGVVVGKLGTAAVSPAELLAALADLR